MAPRTSISALTTLLTLFVAPQISSALQVTPNSPCSSACRDSLDLDTSDPNSSNTRGTDITCLDTAYSSAAGTKFKDCMTCLQTSTFSQGSESDTMWFLYFVALEAGCRQQPASGVLLGLDDTIFSVNRISIVDPTTLKQKQDGTPKQGLSTPAIVGIAAGGMVFLLVVAGFTFVCLRKRKNKQKRASAEADFYNKINNRHRSTGSFQCQTHMISPRFWPSAGNEEATPTPMSDAPDAPDAHDRRSSILKPHGPDPYPEQDTTTTTLVFPPRKPPSTPHNHHPTPPQAHTSPSTAGVGPYYSPSDITYPTTPPRPQARA
ncbi:hypothetical protein N0V88_001094 [Collariella sp. IMI 366227]|nr:hypothetical protein N0V88_001094 [Collariella sp. IMI 366227]